jgi:helicase
MHTLALIASNFVRTRKSLVDFFSSTFYAFQYGNISIVEDKLYEILDMLEECGFVKKDDENLRITRIGKRISELYIDPLTANHFIEALNSRRKATPFSILQTISNTIEMPLLSIRTGEFSELGMLLVDREKEFLKPIPDEWELDFDNFLRSVKTALLLESWINEATEDEILTTYKVAPGELYARLTIADWLIYSLQEIAFILGKKDKVKTIRKTRVRLKYGVKEELIPLVKLKKIGRIRARRLFNAGMKTLNDLRKIPLISLEKIIGPQIAKVIKDQLEGRKLKTEKQKTLI